MHAWSKKQKHPIKERVRLTAQADCSIFVGIGRSKRIRRKLGLRCQQKRKFNATTHSKHTLPVAPNLLARDFTVPAPNQAWVSDITYIPTAEGWLFLVGLPSVVLGRD
ncbi:hypothetical protein MGMO_72c00130 [Methyloglobulus morosus KoM1]|uniref:Transposase n=1 Tax=Methyloglobulus morosus KoM1 TaxID=1116472 RepID=V5C0W1_9GAMM|nr:hypothetical protein MGMO_72c00130 [Methyloglobulus morosus KoM1]